MTTDIANTSYPQERIHDACGVAMIVNMRDKPSHDVVVELLKRLAEFDHRAGTNVARNNESDGAGIRFQGLSTTFFEKKFNLKLTEKAFSIGSYFLPTDESECEKAKALIESTLHDHGLKIGGWRDLNSEPNVNLAHLADENAQRKKPSIWQAVLIPDESAQFDLKDLESTTRKAALEISRKTKEQQIALDIVSQSSESIVYKGMLRPAELGVFYRDLMDPDFTATGGSVHARFSTNTESRWPNAQPCPFFVQHNGEFNSAGANKRGMHIEGIYPNSKLSDSMQFDLHIASLMDKYNIPLEEAFLCLMPPPESDEYSAELKAMLKYLRLIRPPYNGPAFVTASSNSYHLAKLDDIGLRPARYATVIDKDGNQQFHAASEDYLVAPEGGAIINKGILSPGGMIMVTPEGQTLTTKEILQKISVRYATQHQDPDYFQHQLEKTLLPLKVVEEQVEFQLSKDDTLNRILYSAGWDKEMVTHVLRRMAEDGIEPAGAMGDDTDPLYAAGMPPHLVYFFHQLFAQVSAPPLDSIKERDRFSLEVALGPTPELVKGAKVVGLQSPILGIQELHALHHQTDVKVFELDTSFDFESMSLQDAIKKLLREAEKYAEENEGGILILTDKNTGPERPLIPDIIAVAAIRKHLEHKKLSHKISIVADSYQISGPHHTSTLLAVGANAVYPRGAYTKIRQIYEHPDEKNEKCENYKKALEKCLLKTMGKLGINDVTNYSNGQFLGVLGLNLSDDNNKTLAEDPTLAKIFGGMYSPLKGYNLNHIEKTIREHHGQSYDPGNDFTLLPYSGQFMPDKNGTKHGYGPEVVGAFTAWLKDETMRTTLWRMHIALVHKGLPGFIENTSAFLAEIGFLDPRQKENGVYPTEYLATFRASPSFKAMCERIEAYRKKYPTSIRDHFQVTTPSATSNKKPLEEVQSTAEIRKTLFSGSMSQGALTVEAHEMLTRGINAVGANSASGEGGEDPDHLRNPLWSTGSKQIASARFGVSAMQILCAEEMEIKIAQGAKPGEGGELPGRKVSIRFAAQRGGLPGMTFISPPPHHDIYSIEDLAQLIHDIKAVNPNIKVAVKLVASEGIGTIAVGVAKAGADVINIASNSGGTGSAQLSSIKSAGFPSETGLPEVDEKLRQAGLRDLVKLRVSGGFKTAEDIIIAAILGADLFELGTTGMLTLGCKMQRTCNSSCQPGVAMDGNLFKGDQINVERYFVNLASAIQERLIELGVSSLSEIKGRTDLLALINPDQLAHYDFSPIRERSTIPSLSQAELEKAKTERERSFKNKKADELILLIKAAFEKNPSAVFESELITLTTQDRSFGAQIAGAFAEHLEKYPDARIILNTTGNAGQSLGCFLPSGISLKHTGPVQDGCAKSMTGGELVLQNTAVGNAMGYGASGGKIYVSGDVTGHRFGILLKGAQVVVENVGDLAFEYMTSGTALILGQAGRGLCTGAQGGIVFEYDNSQPDAEKPENNIYSAAIRTMLEEHIAKTNSPRAKTILNHFNINHFKVHVPATLNSIVSTLASIKDIAEMYRLQKKLPTIGEQVWLGQKTLSLVESATPAEKDEFNQWLHKSGHTIFSGKTYGELLIKTKNTAVSNLDFPIPAHAPVEKVEKGEVQIHSKPKKPREIEKRLEKPDGTLDDELLDAVKHIATYAKTLGQEAQGCSGCRAQSCAGGEEVNTGCPSGKNINSLNDTLKRLGPIDESGELTPQQWKILQIAFKKQIKESPFIAYTGAACPAPCQDACTETIPEKGGANPKRGGKAVGEPVHIKNIEFYLYLIGRSKGWFDQVFTRKNYQKQSHQELIIIGSGPAAMQLAYRALRDGVTVRMFEQSNTPGGLLADGIPQHKFNKQYLAEDFEYLKKMGLILTLNTKITAEDIARDFQGEHQHVALCVGLGQPKFLPKSVTSTVDEEHSTKIVQAVNFLKAANEVAAEWSTTEDKDALIKKWFGTMDPCRKKIVVVGGGDTAQDVIRWLARYFNYDETKSGQLNVVMRRDKPSDHRGIVDAFPAPSRSLTEENKLKEEEVTFVHGKTSHLVEISEITVNPQGKLTVQVKKTPFKYHDEIQRDPELQELSNYLPYEQKPKDFAKTETEILRDVDMVICALGFEGKDSIPLVKNTAHLKRTYLAGDVTGVESAIIVGAQASANKTYEGQIRPAMGLFDNKPTFWSQKADFSAPKNIPEQNQTTGQEMGFGY